MTELDFDVKKDLLKNLHLSGLIFLNSQLQSPWGIQLPKLQFPRFHIVLKGQIHISVEDKAAQQINEMEIALIPNGSSHSIADQPDRELIHSEDIDTLCQFKFGNTLADDMTHHLICGLIQYDRSVFNLLLDSLPPIIYFPDLKSTDPVWMTVLLLKQEMAEAQDFRSPIIDRLAEVLFLQLITLYINRDTEASPFLHVLEDNRIGKALKLIHHDPGVDWSVDSLGERVGMSRSTLNRHFLNLTGISPMTYLTNLRLQKARNMMIHSDMPLNDIALSVGFSSSRTLAKAFKRHYGYKPSQINTSHD